MRKITIPAPKFELHQLVTLEWDGKTYNNRSVNCWYDLHSGMWWYELYDHDRKYPGDYITLREVEAESIDGGESEEFLS